MIRQEAHATALAVLSVALVVYTFSWFKWGVFEPLQDADSRATWLRTSLYFAAPASVIALVAVPVFAYYAESDTYFVFAVCFYVFEALWLPATWTSSFVFVVLVLFAAASAITACLIAGLYSVGLQTPLGVAMLVTFFFPVANVWLNDFFYYCYHYRSMLIARSVMQSQIHFFY